MSVPKEIKHIDICKKPLVKIEMGLRPYKNEIE